MKLERTTLRMSCEISLRCEKQRGVRAKSIERSMPNSNAMNRLLVGEFGDWDSYCQFTIESSLKQSMTTRRKATMKGIVLVRCVYSVSHAMSLVFARTSEARYVLNCLLKPIIVIVGRRHILLVHNFLANSIAHMTS